MHPSYVNCHLKVKYPLHFCQLFSTHYTAVQIKNYLKSTFVIKVATMKNEKYTLLKGKPSYATTKSTLFAASKDEWNTKEDTE